MSIRVCGLKGPAGKCFEHEAADELCDDRARRR